MDKKLHLYDIATRSTVHCVSEVALAERRSWKIFWTVMIIVGVFGAAFEVYRVIHRFLQSPLITVNEIVPSNSLPFPTVEICPTHVVNATKTALLGIHPILMAFALMSLGDMARISIDAFVTTPNEPFDQDTFAYIVASSPTKEIALQQIDGLVKMMRGVTLPASYLEGIYAHNSSVLDSQYAAFLENLGMNSSGKTYNKTYAQLKTEELLDLVGLDQDDVFLNCQFLALDVNCSSVVRPVFDQKYGRCFVVDVARDQMLNGVGLTLLLNINTDDVYEEFPGISDGMVIRINDVFNPVSYRTIMIPVGAYSSVVLRTTKYELKTARTNQICRDDVPRQVTTFPYSDTVCRLECFHQMTLRKCNCTAALPNEFLTDHGNGSIRQCKAIHEMLCIIAQSSDEAMHENRNCTNQCKPRCSYWEYTPLVSYSRFPSRALSKRLGRIGINMDEWYKNYVLLEVSFDELLYNRVRQEESATFDQLAGEIGGHFSLFLGASLLSLIQILVICMCGGKAGRTEQGPEAKCTCCELHQPSDRALNTSASNETVTENLHDIWSDTNFQKQEIYEKALNNYVFTDFGRDFGISDLPHVPTKRPKV